MDSYSDILFSEPSFLEGIARVLDLGNTLTEYNNSLTPEQADYIAAAADWTTVGNDLHAAMKDEADIQAHAAIATPNFHP